MSADELAHTLEDVTGKETRAVVPGYIQRGGSPTQRDRILGSLLGAKAVRLLYDDEESRAVGVVGQEIIACPLEEAVNMPTEFDQRLYDLAVRLS